MAKMVKPNKSYIKQVKLVKAACPVCGQEMAVDANQDYNINCPNPKCKETLEMKAGDLVDAPDEPVDTATQDKKATSKK